MGGSLRDVGDVSRAGHVAKSVPSKTLHRLRVCSVDREVPCAPVRSH